MVYSASAPSLSFKGSAGGGNMIEKIQKRFGSTPAALPNSTPTPVPTPELAEDRPQMNATLSGRVANVSPIDAMMRTIETGGIHDPLSEESITELTKHSIHSLNGFLNQLGALVIGVVFMAALYLFVPIDRYNYKFLTVALIITFILLLSVYGFEARKGAHRWVPLMGFTLQPSELAKLVFCLWVSKRLTMPTKYEFCQISRPETKNPLRQLWRKICPSAEAVKIGSVAAALMAVIVLEPDMGATFSLAVMFFAIIVAHGLHQGWIFSAIGLGLGLVWLGVTLVPYRIARFMAFLSMEDPEVLNSVGYQLNQSLIALGSGGIWGKGIGSGMQKYQYLTEIQNDFIFALIGEELGLAGTITVILLFGLFVTVGLSIARNARTEFARLVAVGISTMIGVSAFIHVAVVIGLAPTKGLTLPFISYGGTSLIINMIAVAILLEIAKDNEEHIPYMTLQKRRRRNR